MSPARVEARVSRPVRPSRDLDMEGAELSEENEDIVEPASQDSEGDESADLSDDDSVTDEHLQQQIGNVSFGALKRAQDGLSKKRKRGSDTNAEHEEKLEILRARIREIRESKTASSSRNGMEKGKNAKAQRAETVDRARSKITNNPDHDSDDENDVASDDDSSAPSEEDLSSRARSSKHAPTAQSSKYQVTRRRNVIDVPKRHIRDPRFDAIHSSSTNPQSDKTEKAYSFLVDYQKDEIAELKSALKKTRDENDRETLRRQIGAMENRLRAKEAKQREQDVIRKHRKEERERVQAGKQPFYLKRKDIKEAALVEKYKGMKGKEREKAMERKQKKESQREKRMMPRARRVAG